MTKRGISYEGNAPAKNQASGTERRVALVIGNGSYSHASPLDNPVRDAEAMTAVLARLGFDVVQGIDLDLRSVGDVQGAFEEKLSSKPDVALLYYAGHGLQVEGRNYLVPIDVEIAAKSHLATRALYFNDLLDDMARDAQASLIFLDACRDNPFTRNLARAMGETARYTGVRGGLARIEKVAGTFIAYATAPDQLAFDGKGQNSPFTSALLDHIETPGLSVGDLMIDVRNKVLIETDGRQEPWDQSSLRARFYFVPPVSTQATETNTPPSKAASEWAAIQGTTSIAVLTAFKERHPDPPWSTYAEARASELRETDAEQQDKQSSAYSLAALSHREQAAGHDHKQQSETTRPHASNSKWPVLLLLGGATVAAAITALVVTRPWEIHPAPTRPELAVPSVAGSSHLVATAEPPASPQTLPCLGIRTNVVGNGTTCLEPANPANRRLQDCKQGFCGPQMVALPTGSYTRGSENGNVNETPVRTVTIRHHLAVGKYEVTFDEWDACLADGGCSHNPSDQGWGRGKRPVINVSWNDITRQYLPWLNRKLGLTGAVGYRLLTEAEWEYAARAGTQTAYSFGESIKNEEAQFSDVGWGVARQTVEVGSFPANRFGLHDMHGNVWEWVQDCYADSYANAPIDGSKASDTNGCSRGRRGGSWITYAQFLGSANRNRDLPDGRVRVNGFRLARTLEPAQ